MYNLLMNKGIIVKEIKTKLGLSANTNTIDLICSAIATGLDFEKACLAIGLSNSDSKKLRKDCIALSEGDPRCAEFTADYKELLRYAIQHIMKAQAEGELELLNIIKTQALGDWKAADRLLQIMRPERYGKRTFIERSDPLTSAAKKTEDFSEMSDEDLRNIIEGEVIPDEVSNITDEELNKTDDE